jgi:hypothetical protein
MNALISRHIEVTHFSGKRGEHRPDHETGLVDKPRMERGHLFQEIQTMQEKHPRQSVVAAGMRNGGSCHCFYYASTPSGHYWLSRISWGIVGCIR